MAARRPPGDRPPTGTDTTTEPSAPSHRTSAEPSLEPEAPRTPLDRALGRGRPKHQKPERRGALGFLRELPGLILIAFLLALLIKTFIIQAFFIPSRSMLPTLQVGDRVIVNKFVYNFGEPQRGDVIVFENPNLVEPDRNPVAAFWHWLVEGLGVSADPNKDFIKRVIGVPGDTVQVKNGRVLINGERIQEPYISEQRDPSDFPRTEVDPDHVFVMGDNRPNSQDSRNIGPVPHEKIVGKAFLLLWPPSRIEWLSDD